jgi:hypothetical protein
MIVKPFNKLSISFSKEHKRPFVKVQEEDVFYPLMTINQDLTKNEFYSFINYLESENLKKPLYFAIDNDAEEVYIIDCKFYGGSNRLDVTMDKEEDLLSEIGM